MSGVRMPIRCLPVAPGEAVRPRDPASGRGGTGRAGVATDMLRRMRPQIEDAVQSAGRRRQRSRGIAPRPPVGAVRGRRAQAACSVWPWPPRPASPTTSPGRRESAGPPPARAGSASTACARGARPRAAPLLGRDAAHRRDQRRRGRRPPAARSATIRPSFITTIRLAVREDLAEDVRDQDHRAARRGRTGGHGREAGPASPASSDEVGSSRITRRGAVPASEKAMAISTIWRSRDRQVADRRIGIDAVAGKDRVEACGDHRARPAPPAAASQRSPVHQPRVLDDGQVGAERQFLKDAAQSARRAPRAMPIAATVCAVGRRSRPAAASARR